MEDFELNLRQKKLVEQLAQLKSSGQLIEPINPFPLGPMNYVIYLNSRYNLRLQWRSDLDMLTMAGYLDFEWNRSGLDKIYRVSELGLSILDDPNFITEADYEKSTDLGEPFSLIDDTTESPNLEHSLQTLLYADFRGLTHMLREIPRGLVSKIEHEGMSREIDQILSNLDSHSPIMSQVIKGIDTIGRKLMHTQSDHFGEKDGEKAANTLLIFVLWSRKVQEKLAEKG